MLRLLEGAARGSDALKQSLAGALKLLKQRQEQRQQWWVAKPLESALDPVVERNVVPDMSRAYADRNAQWRGIQAAAQFGFSMHDYLVQGLGTVSRRTRIEYKQPAILGDTLEITTYLSDPRPVRATRHFIFRRQSDQALIAQGYVLWVFIDLKTGRPTRLPEELMEEFAPHIAIREESQP